MTGLAENSPSAMRSPVQLDRAHDTLLRGAAHLSRHVAPRCDEAASVSGVHAPFIGNALGELDRFLNVLVDEAARWLGEPIRPEQRNTANKLRTLKLAMGESDRGHARLSAVGRSRDYLKHSGGRDATGAARQPDEVLTMSSADLLAICRLYSDAGRDLRAVALSIRPR